MNNVFAVKMLQSSQNLQVLKVKSTWVINWEPNKIFGPREKEHGRRGDRNSGEEEINGVSSGRSYQKKEMWALG